MQDASEGCVIHTTRLGSELPLGHSFNSLWLFKLKQQEKGRRDLWLFGRYLQVHALYCTEWNEREGAEQTRLTG